MYLCSPATVGDAFTTKGRFESTKSVKNALVRNSMSTLELLGLCLIFYDLGSQPHHDSQPLPVV